MGLIGDYAPCKRSADASHVSMQNSVALEPTAIIEIASWTDPATQIWFTRIPKNVDPLSYFLARAQQAARPVLAVSPFVPSRLVHHLMAKKKDSALSVKYKRGDEITNMEAMMHSFVIPFVPIIMVGDYAYHNGHSLAKLGTDENGNQKARVVIMSGLIQPDFEHKDVTWELAKLGPSRVRGKVLEDDFTIPSAMIKAGDAAGAEYDLTLKRHAVHHLVERRFLPAKGEISALQCLDIDQAILWAEKVILDTQASQHAQSLAELFVIISRPEEEDTFISLEILANLSFHQIRNELRAMERMIPAEQGYVYIWDPAAIYAYHLDPTLLNRLTILGMRRAIQLCPPEGMKVFAFNDYADPKAVRLLEKVFENLPLARSIPVVAKASLFPTPDFLYDPSRHPEAARAALVVHNNSDAFGQNIQTEAPGGSMSGSFGAYSSAAASLRRERDWTAVETV